MLSSSSWTIEELKLWLHCSCHFRALGRFSKNVKWCKKEKWKTAKSNIKLFFLKCFWQVTAGSQWEQRLTSKWVQFDHFYDRRELKVLKVLHIAPSEETSTWSSIRQRQKSTVGLTTIEAGTQGGVQDLYFISPFHNCAAADGKLALCRNHFSLLQSHCSGITYLIEQWFLTF